ncbi:MAG: nucleotidyltransferase family protein [Cyclobacteriaceae bacterium]|nr:nucleotidyltransferase family protein [Cyclobacteriaceae bacterium]MCK5280815.1 nucleotidyltransferase family protein [Cyclobacteriaceae bacterium]MCK5470733.1 nucleotidyltransferase family protein [Cyclobacteriaceae bacterium]MCK5704521.1 nucleotidyltransferase family protein [Cyclobacteriaceae bacterium]
MLSNKTKIELLIMAAGASRRLGQPKQLLEYKGESLIRRISKEALKAKIGNITVVLGYDNKNIEKEITDLKVNVFFNEEWEEGLGASIRNGLKYILDNKPDTNAILLSMVDQPFVDAVHLKKLANAYDAARKMIIASAYSGTFGVPVLIDSFYFDLLKELKGDEGGKKIFVNYIKDIVEIPFIEGAIDIDEKKDLKTLE